MCQLTYVNLQDKVLNAHAVFLLTTIGSEKHDDGTGIILADNSIWKTKIAAEKILNLGDILSKYITNKKPIPAHIRWATYGIAVNDENAHPFIGKHFILMHNGTLLPKVEEKKNKDVDSDSKQFLDSLDKALDDNPAGSFEEIFNKAMQKYAGKFAFIIRNKDTSTDYIIRGKTADLYIAYVEEKGVRRGYVINTSKDLLTVSIRLLSGMIKISHNLDLTMTEPELLKNETIYKATKVGIEVVGTTKEYEVIKPVQIVQQSGFMRLGSATPSYVAEKTGTEKMLKLVNRIYDFTKEHLLQPIDIQRIFLLTMGLSLLEANEEDFAVLVDYVIPKISASKNTKKKIAKLLAGKTNVMPDDIYTVGNLEYPWMVNDSSQVITALEKVLKTK